jgi:DNA-binding beta-propeller fold protein YncE
MKSELAVPRSLHFSPLGSGPRVLVAAEADDYINIINAQTWDSKQVFDFFGPVGGAAFTPDGQSLFIANGEKRFGGIIELDRVGWPDASARRNSLDHEIWDDVATDWAHDDVLNLACGKVHGGDVARRRRNVDLSTVVV